MTRPLVSFNPGQEPEVVHTQHSIPAPRMAVVSLDTLLMMRSNLAGWAHHADVKTVVAQIDRMIKAAQA